MKKIMLLTLSLLSLNAWADPFAGGDAKQGKALFDKHNCNSCHVAMLNGGPETIFVRPDRKVKAPADLSAQIKRCGSVGAKLTPQEELHVSAYLNQAFYKFK